MSHSPEIRHRDGFSLIEVLIGMTILSMVMLGLGGAAALGLAQMAKARQDLQYSADVQQVGDSLVAKGWNKVTSGSQIIRGRTVGWTVTTLNAKSQKVVLIAQRRGQANTSVIYSDTLTLYLADPKVQ
ncbi:MAG TPA: prepilin-type N-terminal cleavage/methylation domain-containing protein [Gemmatimonadaceae bacterium]|nr:prepilin-type N-terminal cleavage/methylation domain-containing protein [Gemmatimonadaceae bacterium]